MIMITYLYFLKLHFFLEILDISQEVFIYAATCLLLGYLCDLILETFGYVSINIVLLFKRLNFSVDVMDHLFLF